MACDIQEGSLIMVKKEFLLQAGLSQVEGFIGVKVLANLLQFCNASSSTATVQWYFMRKDSRVLFLLHF